MDGLKNTLKKWNSVFCRSMVCKTNIKRDIIVVFFAVLAAAVFLSANASNPVPKRPEGLPIPLEDRAEAKGVVAGEAVAAPVVVAENINASDAVAEKAVEPEPEKEQPQLPTPPQPKTVVPKKKPAPRPRITAPKPISFKSVGGKLVCAKKNDKPHKSKKGKGKHLDMECCLDPDETPNPWCTY